MAYTRDVIINKVQEALQDPATLYTADVLNYRGSADGELYTEIVARELLKPENLARLDSIATITRNENYKTESHAELAARERPKDSNRDEEWIAISMYGKTFDYIGEVIDFQTPLKNVRTDKAGKIDLLSYDDCYGMIYALELKKPDSKETLLRCILEAFTYVKIVDHEKLAVDFGYDSEVNEDDEKTTVKAAVLVGVDSLQHNDWLDSAQPFIRELLNRLNVGLFMLGDERDGAVDCAVVRTPLDYFNSSPVDDFEHGSEVDGELLGYGITRYKGTSKTVVIPQWIGDNEVLAIGSNAFRGCETVESIAIHAGINFFGDNVFAECKNLKTFLVDPNNELLSVKDGVLFGISCKILHKYPPQMEAVSYTVPDGVDFIEPDAFENCKNLHSITIPKSVEGLGAFEGCNNLKEVIIYADKSEIDIPKNAFPKHTVVKFVE